MYTPHQTILDNYAKVLVRFALGGGTGVKPGEVVILTIPECAKLMVNPLQKAVLEAGAHFILQYTPADLDRQSGGTRTFFEYASEEQLQFFAKDYYQGLIAQTDHSLTILADEDMHKFDGIDSAKIMMRQQALKPWRDMRMNKEHEGKFTWTLALFGTDAMAAEAGLSIEAYWQQIIDACFLADEDPIATWRQTFAEVERVRMLLTAMKIEEVHIEAAGTDLWIAIGDDRQWLGGSGRNIPSFEVFTSPDWRGTRGTISFTQPLYLYGQKADGIKLVFENGCVTGFDATQGKAVLEQVLAVPDANKLGEFSLTDGRLSKITTFMANTLFDENVGGPEGNTHVALGMAYKDTYTGDIQALSQQDWQEKGFNDSSVHLDIMSTSSRKVTAHWQGRESKVIYEHGQFLI